jgi:hypothetical protein
MKNAGVSNNGWEISNKMREIYIYLFIFSFVFFLNLRDIGILMGVG